VFGEKLEYLSESMIVDVSGSGRFADTSWAYTNLSLEVNMSPDLEKKTGTARASSVLARRVSVSSLSLGNCDHESTI